MSSDAPSSSQQIMENDFHNPFSTRFTRPGAIEYQIAEAENQRAALRKIVQQFIAIKSTGQIVGPHGSGKSTLVQSLVPHLRAAQWTVDVIQLRDGQRRLPAIGGEQRRWDANTVLIVDGYEQLNRWAQYRLGKQQRRQGFRLLVTTHCEVRMRLIWRTVATEATLVRIVEQLTADLSSPLRPSQQQVRDAFNAHDGNLREALFDLYDIVSQRRKQLRGSLEQK